MTNLTVLKSLLERANPCSAKTAVTWLDNRIVVIGATPDGEHFAELVTPAEFDELQKAYAGKFRK